MQNNSEIKILFVEDMPPFYEIAVSLLDDAGISFISELVDTEELYIEKLNSFKPDLIISDYCLPAFDGMRALKLLLEYDRLIPFIVLTGTQNEEVAVNCMKAGAVDYVLKEHIAKLPLAVKEALHKKSVILEKIQAEEALRTSLNQKTELIREVFHRTKNSLNVIISILSLQKLSIDDEYAADILDSIENRIRAMALVHDKLYRSNDLSKLDLGEYISDLLKNIRIAYTSSDEKIKLIEEIDSYETLIDTAVPCGLVINELVTNSYKHAFPGDMSGEIKVALKRGGDGLITLSVSDNGRGLPDGFNPENDEKVGYQIIKTVSEEQLKGKISLESGRGVTWRLTFRDNRYRERV